MGVRCAALTPGSKLIRIPSGIVRFRTWVTQMTDEPRTYSSGDDGGTPPPKTRVGAPDGGRNPRVTELAEMRLAAWVTICRQSNSCWDLSGNE